MCNRLCYVAVAAVLLLVAVKASHIAPPFQFNAFPVHFSSFGNWSETSADEVVIDKTFKVSQGDDLVIDVGHSDVSVETGPAGQAGVQVIISGEDARRFFDYLNYSVDKQGTTVSVTTNPRGNWNRGGGNIEVVVTIPERFDASVEVAHGDLQVDRMDGRLDFRLAHGDLSARSLSGSSLDIDVAHGDLDADRLMSEKIKLRTAHGDMSVSSLTAADFDIDVQHGDIEIDRADGYARVSAAHGDIDIAFIKLNGGEFANSHGDIDITAPSGAAADVDFAADEIDISAGHGFVGTLKDERAQGRVSGGGAKLVARTSHGDISLREL